MLGFYIASKSSFVRITITAIETIMTPFPFSIFHFTISCFHWSFHDQISDLECEENRAPIAWAGQGRLSWLSAYRAIYTPTPQKLRVGFDVAAIA